MNALLQAVCLWAMLLFAGCSPGSATSLSETAGGYSYEARLKATADAFAYHSLLDANLTSTPWEDHRISLRVPLPFEPIPLPAQPDAGSGEILGAPLPGVLGIWKADFPAKNAGPPQIGYIFLMSNHYLWPSSRTAAMAFHQVLVEDVLAELPGLVKLPIEADWRPENIAGHGQPYTVGRLEATLPKSNTPARLTMYLFQHGTNDRRDEIKVALLFVIPENADFAGSLPDVDPKALSAQSLRIIPHPMDPP